MISKKSIQIFSLLGALPLSLAGCGAGQDPLALIDPTLDPIVVSLPFSGGSTIVSANADLFSWNLTGFSGAQAQVLAPAAGVVTNLNLANGLYDITIRVNSRYSVRVGAMTTPANVREGDTLDAGTLIGNTTSAVTLAILEDGEATCPLPHLNATAQATVAAVAASTVCQ
jgi:hypothetical protein